MTPYHLTALLLVGVLIGLLLTIASSLTTQVGEANDLGLLEQLFTNLP